MSSDQCSSLCHQNNLLNDQHWTASVIFQEHQLNSRRFPVFAGVPEVVDALHKHHTYPTLVGGLARSTKLGTDTSLPCRPPHPSDAAPHRRRLRSANRNCLTVPRCRLSTYSCRAFHYDGPTVWNSLPDELWNSDSFDSFKRFLKTILFSRYSY